jgi:hypothetical protein
MKIDSSEPLLVALRTWIADVVRQAVKESMSMRPPTPNPISNSNDHLPNTPFVTVPEAARIASAHPKTILKLLRLGTLNTYGIGRTKRVNVQELLRYLSRDQGENQAPADLDLRARELALSTTKNDRRRE